MESFHQSMIFVVFVPQLLLWLLALVCYFYRGYRPVTPRPTRERDPTSPARKQNLENNFCGVRVITPILTPFGTAIPGKCKDINSVSLDMPSPLSERKKVQVGVEDLCSVLEGIFSLETTTLQSPKRSVCTNLSFSSKDDMFLEMSKKKCKKMSMTLRCLLPLEAMSSTTTLPDSPLPHSTSKAVEHRWKCVGKGLFAKFDSNDSFV